MYHVPFLQKTYQNYANKVLVMHSSYIHDLYRKADGQTNRQTDRQTDTQTDRKEHGLRALLNANDTMSYDF